MVKFFKQLHPIVFILLATIFEVSGDAIIRKCIYNYTGISRIAFFVVGAALLLCYGFFLNLAPVEFAQLAGLYIATLFIVWQVINYISFRTLHFFTGNNNRRNIYNCRRINYYILETSKKSVST